jgi:RND superfamily putative drug exporter
MSLLGHRAWWLPAWLERRLPSIDIEGGEHDGEEQPVAEPVADESADKDRELTLV